MKFIKTNQESCSENWNKMTPTEKGKICDSCSTKVIDFTKLTQSEILNELRNSNEKICSRIKQSQIETPLINFNLKTSIFKRSKTFASLILISSIINNINAGSIRPIKSLVLNKELTIEKNKYIIYRGNIFSETLNKNIRNVKIEFITLNKTYTTYSSKNGKFKLKIPTTQIKENNIIKISFNDIIEDYPKTLEEFEKATCPVCLYDTQIINLSQNELNKPLNLKVKGHMPYLGSSDFILIGSKGKIPLVYYKGKEITYDEFKKDRKLKKYTEINYFSHKYVKDLCGKENKYGIYICL